MTTAYYPEGAAHDPRAPWAETPDEPEDECDRADEAWSRRKEGVS